MIRTFVGILIGLVDAGMMAAVFFAWIIPLHHLDTRSRSARLILNSDAVKVVYLFLGLGFILAVLSYFLSRYMKPVSRELYRKLLLVPGFALALMAIRLGWVLIITLF